MNIGDLVMDLVVNTGNLNAQMGSIKNVIMGTLGGVLTGVIGGQIDKLATDADRANKQFDVWQKTLQRFKVSNDEANSTVQFLTEKFGVLPGVVQEAATTFLRGGGTMNEFKLAMLAAGSSAAATGFDISSAMKNVSTALITGRSELVESASLITNFGPEYDKFARSIGKTAEQLTEQERIQAGLNSILKESQYEIADVDTLMQGLAGTNAKLNTAQANLSKTVGELFVPVVNQAKQEATGVIEQLVGWANTNKNVLYPSIQAGYDIISGLGMLAAGVVGKVVMSVTSLFAVIGQVIGRASVAVQDSFRMMAVSVDKLLKGDIKGAGEAAAGIKNAFLTPFSGLGDDIADIYEKSFSGLNKLSKDAEARLSKGFTSAWKLMNGEIPKTEQAVQKVASSTIDLSKYLNQNTASTEKASDAKKRLREALKSAQNELDTLTRKFDLQIISEGQYRTGLNQLITKYDALMRKQKEGTDQWDTYSAIVKGAKDALGDLNRTAEETQTRLAALQKNDARKTFVDGLGLPEIERRLAQIPDLLRKATSPEQLDDVLNLEQILLARKGELEQAFNDAGQWMGEAMQDGLMEKFSKGGQKPATLFGLDEIKRNLGDIATENIPKVVAGIESLLGMGVLDNTKGDFTEWLNTLKERADAAKESVDALIESQKFFLNRQTEVDFASWQESLKSGTVEQLQGYKGLLESQLAQAVADQDVFAVTTVEKRLEVLGKVIEEKKEASAKALQKGVDAVKKVMADLKKQGEDAEKAALELAAIGPDQATVTPPGDTQGLDSLLPPVEDLAARVEQYQAIFKNDPFGLEAVLQDLLESSDETTPGLDKLVTALEAVQKQIGDAQLQMAGSGGDLTVPFKAFGESDFLDTRERVLSLTDVIQGLKNQLKDDPEAFAVALLELSKGADESAEGFDLLQENLISTLKLINDSGFRENLGKKFLEGLLGDGDWKDIKFVDDLERIFDQLMSAGFGDLNVTSQIADRIQAWRKEISDLPTEGMFTEQFQQEANDLQQTSEDLLATLKLVKESYSQSADKSGLLADLQELEGLAVRAGLEGSDALKQLRSDIGDLQAEMMKPEYGENLAQALMESMFGQGFDVSNLDTTQLQTGLNTLVSLGLRGSKVGEAFWAALGDSVEAEASGEEAERLRQQFWDLINMVDFSDPSNMGALDESIQGVLKSLAALGVDVSGLTGIWAAYKGSLEDVAKAQQYLNGITQAELPAWETYARTIDDLALKASGPLQLALAQLAIDIRKTGEAHDDATASVKKQEDAYKSLKKRIEQVMAVLSRLGSAIGGPIGELTSALDGLGNDILNAVDSFRSGDMFGGVTGLISGAISFGKYLFDGITSAQRSWEAFERQVDDTQKRYKLIDIGGFITPKWSAGLLGSSFGGTWSAEMNELGLSIAQTLEGGVKSGLGTGIKDFLSGAGGIMQGLQDGFANVVASAITEAVIDSAVMKGALGGLLTDLTKSITAGDYGVAAGLVGQITSQIPALAANLETVLGPLKGILGGSTEMQFPQSTMGALPVGVSSAISAAQMEGVTQFGNHVAAFGRALREGLTISINQDGAVSTSRMALV